MSLVLAFWFALFNGPAHASTPEPTVDSDYGIFDRGGDEEREEEIDEAEEEELRKKRDRKARVVVLKWDGTTTDYRDDTVRRNVRSRIDRPDALFFPSTDLYQPGRRHPDDTIQPRYQPSWVPDGNLDVVMMETSRVSQIPWDAKSPAEWQLIARELIKLTDSMWFVEKVEQREPLFMLYAYIGYAAENGNNPAPPFYEAIGAQSVNYYYYLAATLAWQDPSLMSKVLDNDIRGMINYYLERIQAGGFPELALDFELENEFDKEEFAKEYEVYLNGLVIDEDIDEQGEYEVPPGRFDIYLKRKDTGHGLSDQLTVDKYKDKNYFVRDDARKKMGSDFYSALMLHPNECTPALDGETLNYLAIYQKLHDQAEIYIAVPRNGDPNKVYIWRYDRPSATLQLVQGDNDDFPVRFAALVSTGIMYNGAAFSVDSTIDNGDLNGILDPSASQVTNRLNTDLQTGHLPLNLQLRGHYNRLMVEVGMEWGWNVSDDGLWVERYRTPEHKAEYGQLMVVDADTVAQPRPEVYHYKAWNRYTYGGVGVVLGPNATLGFGPRFSLRSGVTDLPWAVQTTGHFGYTLEPPLDALKSATRVRPFVDFDARIGASVALNNSIQRDISELEDEEGFVKPVFGITAGIGTTF